MFNKNDKYICLRFGSISELTKGPKILILQVWNNFPAHRIV